MITRWLTTAGSALITLAALMWPALYNGQAFYFTDTPTYIRGAAAGFEKLTGFQTHWTADDAVIQPSSSAPDDVGPPTVSSIKDKIVLSGRSIYYGALLFVGDLWGHFWLVVLVQALLLLLAMGLLLRAFEVDLWPNLFVIASVVGIFTSASFFVSFLMPDLFAAVTVICCAVLAATRVAKRDYLVLCVLLCFALVTHASHVLVAASMLGIGVLAQLRQTHRDWRGAAAIAGSLLVAAAAQSCFNAGVKHLVGAAPLTPPFLTARLIEDGPGYRYLRQACPAAGFAVCNYLSVLPMEADAFIWNTTPPSVFGSASPDVRRQLSAEQIRVVLGTVRNESLSLAVAMGTDVFKQALMFGVPEFGNTGRLNFAARLPVEYRQAFRATPGYRNTMPIHAAAMVQAVVVCLGIVTLVWIFAQSRASERLKLPQRRIILWIVLGVVLNTVICGILSGPHDRYEARVIWLIPFVAMTALLSLRRPGEAGQGNR